MLRAAVQSPITTTTFPTRPGMQAHSGEGYNSTSWTNFWPCLQGAIYERQLAHGNISTRCLSIFGGIVAASSATAYLCIGRDRVKKPSIHDVEYREKVALCGCFVASAEGLHNTPDGGHVPVSGPDHLVVLVNGIAGSPANWKFMDAQFKERCKDRIQVHLSESNSFLKTLEGVDVMGTRLAEEVVEVVAAHRQLKKISFVAHSMGGLVARYAIGLLYVPPGATPTSTHLPLANACVADVVGGTVGNGKGEGISTFSEPQEETVEEGFRNQPSRTENGDSVGEGDGDGDGVKVLRDIEEGVMIESQEKQERWGSRDRGTIAGLTPVNFVTIATPHLGCVGKGHLPFLFNMNFLERASPTIAPALIGRTGLHLFLADGPPPLLVQMVEDNEDGAFISALKAFKWRAAYANTGFDQMVGWRTASIRRATEMPLIPKQEANPQYRHIMRVEDLPGVAAAGREGKMVEMDEGNGRPVAREIVGGGEPLEPLNEHEDVIVTALQQMPWTRVDVSFQNTRVPWMAHNLIQVKSKWMHADGASVIRHVLDHLEI